MEELAVELEVEVIAAFSYVYYQNKIIKEFSDISFCNNLFFVLIRLYKDSVS